MGMAFSVVMAKCTAHISKISKSHIYMRIAHALATCTHARTHTKHTHTHKTQTCWKSKYIKVYSSQTVLIRSVIIKDYLLMPYQSINAKSHDNMKIKNSSLKILSLFMLKKTSQSVCIVLIHKWKHTQRFTKDLFAEKATATRRRGSPSMWGSIPQCL